MQAGAHVQREPRHGHVLGQRALQGQCGLHAVDGIVEHGVDAVAGALDQVAAVGLHGGAAELVVLCQRAAHRLGLALPQPGAAFDVGEEERRGGGVGAHAGRCGAVDGRGRFCGQSIARRLMGLRVRGPSGRLRLQPVNQGAR